MKTQELTSLNNQEPNKMDNPARSHRLLRWRVRLVAATAGVLLLTATCGGSEVAIDAAVSSAPVDVAEEDKAFLAALKTTERARLRSTDNEDINAHLSARITANTGSTMSSAKDEDEANRGGTLMFNDLLSQVSDLSAYEGFTFSPQWVKGEEGQPDGYWKTNKEDGGYACSIGGGGEFYIPLNEAGQVTDEGVEQMQEWWDSVEGILGNPQVWIGGYRNPDVSDYVDQLEINISLVFRKEADAVAFGESVWQDSVYDVKADDVVSISYKHRLP